MKKLILLFIFASVIFCGNAFASGLTITFVDTISARDSTADSVIVDTSIGTEYAEIGDFRFLQFYIGLISDTNWVNDTFFILAQTSVDKTYWNTFSIDTLLNTDTIFGTPILDRDASVLGRYLRPVLIHKDSVEADRPDIFDSTYTTTIEFEVIGH